MDFFAARHLILNDRRLGALGNSGSPFDGIFSRLLDQ